MTVCRLWGNFGVKIGVWTGFDAGPFASPPTGRVLPLPAAFRLWPAGIAVSRLILTWLPSAGMQFTASTATHHRLSQADERGQMRGTDVEEHIGRREKLVETGRR